MGLCQSIYFILFISRLILCEMYSNTVINVLIYNPNTVMNALIYNWQVQGICWICRIMSYIWRFRYD